MQRAFASIEETPNRSALCNMQPTVTPHSYSERTTNYNWPCDNIHSYSDEHSVTTNCNGYAADPTICTGASGILNILRGIWLTDLALSALSHTSHTSHTCTCHAYRVRLCFIDRHCKSTTHQISLEDNYRDITTRGRVILSKGSQARSHTHSLALTFQNSDGFVSNVSHVTITWCRQSVGINNRTIGIGAPTGVCTSE